MPVPAAWESHVFPGDAHPPEVLWRGEHLPQQLAVFPLDPLPLRQGDASLGDSVGQAVAHRLQLAEVEYPRRGGHRPDPVGHFGVAEGRAEQSGELRLEA